jgi:hypothetical protein
MPRGVSRDATHLKDILDKGVILVDGDADGTIDVGAGKDDPVWVGIIVDVSGYGPNTGTIYAMQNRYHGNADEPLQAAEELLETWKHEHEADYYKELERDARAEHPDLSDQEFWDEYGHEVDAAFRENFDGWSFKLDPREFGEAINGTDAEKYIKTYDSHAEKREELRERLREVRAFCERYEDEIPPREVKERSTRIERLLESGDLDEAEREIESLHQLSIT